VFVLALICYVQCELTGDLVDSCIPGDVVTVSGVVKARKSDAPKGGGRNRARTVFLLYLDVNAIDNTKDSNVCLC
jgi:DNA helicase MCM8